MTDDLKGIVEAEERRRARQRARHGRETNAQLGKFLGISREMIRQAGIVDRTFADGRDLVESGQHTVNELYNLAVGDDRVGLYVKVSRGIRERARDEAERRGITLAELVALALTQISG